MQVPEFCQYGYVFIPNYCEIRMWKHPAPPATLCCWSRASDTDCSSAAQAAGTGSGPAASPRLSRAVPPQGHQPSPGARPSPSGLSE